MSVEDLRVAALEGDLKRVQEILKKGKVDINKNFFFLDRHYSKEENLFLHLQPIYPEISLDAEF